MYAEEDYLMLSGIQHFAFCARQWAMIHIEQQWAENYYTVILERKNLAETTHINPCLACRFCISVLIFCLQCFLHSLIALGRKNRI